MSHICFRLGTPPSSGTLQPEPADVKPDVGSYDFGLSSAVNSRPAYYREPTRQQFYGNYTLAETVRCIKLCIAGVSELIDLATVMQPDADARHNQNSESLCGRVYYELAKINLDLQTRNTDGLKCEIIKGLAKCYIYYQIKTSDTTTDHMVVHPSDMYRVTKGQTSRNTTIEDTESPFYSWFASGKFIFCNETVCRTLSNVREVTLLFQSSTAVANYTKNGFVVDTINNIVIGKPQKLKVDANQITLLERNNRELFCGTSNLLHILHVLRDDTVAEQLSVKILSFLSVEIPGHYMVNADLSRLFEYYIDRHQIDETNFVKEYISPLAALLKASLSRDRFLALGAMRHRQSRAYDDAVTRCEGVLVDVKNSVQRKKFKPK